MSTHRYNSETSLLDRTISRAFWIWAAATAFFEMLIGRIGSAHGEPIRLDVRFEHSDINVRAVAITGAGILLSTWAIAACIYFLFAHFAHVHQVESPSPLPLTAGASHKGFLPPEPRLQESPSRELEELRSLTESDLHKYSWVDRQKGTVTIPIDRAIDLVVERGIPAQKAPPNLFYQPSAGSRLTGFEGKVEPEPR